jgi:serine/threonine-protein kinase
MGTVWAARDETLKRPVAVKVLNEAFSEDERFIERFRREAKAAAGLVHPNVAGVFDYGEDDRRPFIVMELIEGQTLAELLRERGPLPPEQVARIGADVAATLALAHDRGIVHRDIKPANVMLTGRGEVKVMDFGIAAEVLAGGTGLTGTGMVLGTARYLSPEQAQGDPATPASDVYSLGVVLYEMLGGQPPFVRSTPMATAMAQVNDPVPPLADERGGVPAELAALVERCLAKDPARRPESAAALAAALRAAATAASDADTAVLPSQGAQTLEESPLSGPATQTDAATARIERRPTARDGESVWTAARRGRGWIVAAVVAAVVAAIVLAVALTSGDAGVKVPRFVGDTRAHAVQRAHRLGLHVRVLRQESARASGVVAEQFPPRGVVLDRGDLVILAVSSGPTTGTGSSPPPPEPAGHGKAKGHGHGKGKGHGKGHGEGE